VDLQQLLRRRHDTDASLTGERRPHRFPLSFSDLALPYRLVGKFSVVLGIILFIYYRDYLPGPGINPVIADKDFANYWMASHLAASGNINDIFGPNGPYLAHLRAVFGPQLPWHNWSYPPHYLMLMMPLALVSYKIGLIAFLALTGCFFWWAFASFCGDRSSLPLAAAAPFLILNTWVAQNGFLTAGLALFALQLRDKRPILAGMCLGLLTVKPQLGFLLPLLFLAERRWRVLAAAVVTTCALVILSLLLFGIGAWKDYVAIVLPYQGDVMAHLEGTFLTMLPSTYGAARLHGVPAGSAMLIHLTVAVPVVFAAIVAIFATRSNRARDYIVLTATFLVTPYSLNYDLGMLAAAIACFIAEGGDAGRGWIKSLLALVMLLPVSMMIAGPLGMALAPPLLLAMFVLMVRHADIADTLGTWLALLRGQPVARAMASRG
jgi:arabinofuranan 3-O-arabinosyltransferase